MAAKKSRERKISKLKELKIQRDRLKKEDRELENLVEEYATRKRFLEEKYNSLQRKIERARLRYVFSTDMPIAKSPNYEFFSSSEQRAY